MAKPQKNKTTNTIIFFIFVIDLNERAKIVKKNTNAPFRILFYKQLNLKKIHILILIFSSVGTLFAQRNSTLIPEHFELSEYPEIAERIVTYFENHGFPFATVSLRAADPEHGDMTPKIIIDTNLFVTFDSIVLKGDVKLSKDFLYPYLGLKKGAPYNEQLMKTIPAKLEELPYATVIRESGVSFVQDKAYLYIYLNKRQTNLFDGYIGLIPIDETTGKIAVNGELNLALQNIFHLGENISLKWQSSEHLSQYLNIALKFPYLFRTRFGVEGNFLLDKQDTSYLTVNFHVGVPYAFINNSYLQPYFDYSSSSILNPKLINFENDSGYVDYRKTLYGIRFHYSKLDYVFNPRRGFEVMADFAAGNRNIQKNSHLDPEYYANIALHRTTYRLSGDFRCYIPIGKHVVIAPRIQSGSLISGSHFYNELFKIGGEDKIRGFNTNDLCASTYLLYSTELRFLFGKQSYAHIFFDGGTYEQQVEGRYVKDSPFGFGLGVNLAVRSGIFYLEYALGHQKKNPLSLKTGVIHFGIKVAF